jgi:predicted metal-dependent hydrolase
MTISKSFMYGADRFKYEIAYVPAKHSRISIHVYPDCSVRVDAPEERTLSEIHQAILKRARWIKQHVEGFRRQREQALPRDYVSGECLFYLGRRYQLKVRNGSNASVKLLRGQICIETHSRTADDVKQLLAAWYRHRAGEVFTRRFDTIVSTVHWLRQPPEWRLLQMKTQWGSCSPSGTILLNPHLIKAPRECIDYVISHELCHLREHNHSPRYYKLLSTLMPHWEAVKGRLDGMAELLLNE